MKFYHFIILLLIIVSLGFKSQNNDDDKIISLFLKSYLTDDKFSVKKDTIFILNKNISSLQSVFIPKLKDKIRKYQKLSDNCEQLSTSKNDSLIRLKKLSPCETKKLYEKFNKTFSIKELDFLKKYELTKSETIYKTGIHNSRVKFLDSLDFYNKKVINFNENNFKLEFRGPFYDENKTKALLEAYEHYNGGTTFFLIFIKKNGEWKMIGNVNF